MNSSTIVQKLWNYCNVLRDDGMSYGDYVEQLTYLLFLKMADERARAPYHQNSPIPAGYDWPSLFKRDGDELFDHYRHTLEKLGAGKGLLGLIFGKAQNKFQDPAKLRRLIVDLIDKENWSALSADVKGDAYEGLLEKNVQHIKTLLKVNGRAGAVVPDNVLFEGRDGRMRRIKGQHPHPRCGSRRTSASSPSLLRHCGVASPQAGRGRKCVRGERGWREGPLARLRLRRTRRARQGEPRHFLAQGRVARRQR